MTAENALIHLASEGVSDKDRAAELRARIAKALEPVIEIVAEAQRDGLRIGWQLGAAFDGRPVIVAIEIARIL